MRVVIGLGCDRGTSLPTLVQAVDAALAQSGLDKSSVQALATIDKKSDEVCINEFAKQHGWNIHHYPAEQLARVPVPNPSETVLKYMGTPAVSEAAAILAAKTDMRDLLLEKFKYRGVDGKNATVSIVKVKDE